MNSTTSRNSNNLLPGILHLVLEAFKGYNKGWLGRAANLVEPPGPGRACRWGGGDFLLAQFRQGEMQ